MSGTGTLMASGIPWGLPEVASFEVVSFESASFGASSFEAASLDVVSFDAASSLFAWRLWSLLGVEISFTIP